jgi:glyoxylase-like metal-dependent hydrolase (beta-lactamase superfamily II)
MAMKLSRLGDIEVIGIQDGASFVSPDVFGDSGAAAHREMVGADGRAELPISAFVVRSRGITAIVDAGLGDRVVQWEPEGKGPQRLEGGRLPAALTAAGVDRTEIDLVLLTHLHLDHNGWVWADDEPFFPNATVRFGRPDWDALVVDGTSETAVMMRNLQDAGRLDPIDADGEVAPGISTLATPGHTPGHTMYVLSSHGRRANDPR